MNLKYIFSIIILLLPNALYANNLAGAIESGLQNSREYIIELHKLKSAKNTQNSAIAEFLPEVSLSYQVGEKQNIRSDNTGLEGFKTETTNTLSITQPIFNGLKGVTNIKKVKAEYLAQKSALEYFKRGLILEIIGIYIENSEYEKILRLTEINNNYYQRILASIKSKGSLTSENEIIDYKVGYINSKSELEDIKNKLAHAKFAYENIIANRPENLEPHSPAILNATLADILNKVTDNPFVKQKHYELIALKHEHKKQVGNFSPSVNLSASQSKQENLVYLNGGDLETKSITLDFKIPLFQKGNEYFSVKESRYNLEISKEEYALTVKEIEKQIKGAYKEYQYAKNIHDSSIKIYALVKQKLNRSEYSYNIKALDLISLLNIKIERNKAKIRRYEANIELSKAYYKLMLLTNKLQEINI